MGFGPDGKEYVVDVKCSMCGAVQTFDYYIQSPTKCTRMVVRGNKTEECGGNVIPYGPRIIEHRGR